MIKSDKDTRYGLDSIVSHDGVKMPCWALPDLSSFPAKVGPLAYDEVKNTIVPIHALLLINFFFLVILNSYLANHLAPGLIKGSVPCKTSPLISCDSLHSSSQASCPFFLVKLAFLIDFPIRAVTQD